MNSLQLTHIFLLYHDLLSVVATIIWIAQMNTSNLLSVVATMDCPNENDLQMRPKITFQVLFQLGCWVMGLLFLWL